jgi:hypothetical protein
MFVAESSVFWFDDLREGQALRVSFLTKFKSGRLLGIFGRRIEIGAGSSGIIVDEVLIGRIFGIFVGQRESGQVLRDFWWTK